MAICDGVARGAQGSNVDRGLKDVDFRKSKNWAQDGDGPIVYRQTAKRQRIFTGGVKRLKLDFHSEKARGAPPYAPRDAVAAPHPRARRGLPLLFVFSSVRSCRAQDCYGVPVSESWKDGKCDLGAISAASSSASTRPHDAIHRYYIGLGCSHLVGAEPECMKTGTLWATEMAKTYLERTIKSGKATPGGSVVVVPRCCAVVSNEGITARVVITNSIRTFQSRTHF